jgi:hypothetical protein
MRMKVYCYLNILAVDVALFQNLIKLLYIILSSDFAFQEDLELCESPSDFILEPWILVQLPFQPLILFQWLVAVFAETLKFESETADFFHLHLPDEFKDALSLLQSILLKHQKALKEAFEFFTNSFKWEPNHSAYQNGCNVIEELIGNMEFILSEQTSHLIVDLKKKVWQGSAMSCLFKWEHQIHCTDGPYSLEFWTALGSKSLFHYSTRKQQKSGAEMYSNENPVSNQQLWDFVKRYAASCNLQIDPDNDAIAFVLKYLPQTHMRSIHERYRHYVGMYQFGTYWSISQYLIHSLNKIYLIMLMSQNDF